ncbi:D-2-hydroxyacid dehydrogenase family protein [Corynebacterium sputi]|uniref:D-2-hydroxyacid dehydrogenase family protein n=1 Tax=Corynebacterium sputi TaxID=489915 RepID=UPI00040152AD|nr:D-2-hydroxyacid dehydrogenase family protein [Corynebacterium sputi]
MKIVVLDDYQDVAGEFADWDSLGAEVHTVTRHVTGEKDLKDLLYDAPIIIAMRERTPFTRSLLASLPQLKLLVSTGKANASIDLDAARDHGIVVCGTESPASSTPELAWGLILSVLRSIPTENQAMRDGGWQSTVGTDLAGHRLGIIGLGRLGGRMARIGQAFDMDVVAWSQNLDPADAESLGVQAVSKEELFSTSDVLTIHYKLSDRSCGIVGAAELDLMKNTAVLINTSRGPLVDTDALIDALEAGSIGGAGIDVYDTEPVPADHPLRTAPRTVLTPHLGYVTRDTYSVFYSQAVENVAAWMAGQPIRVLT